MIVRISRGVVQADGDAGAFTLIRSIVTYAPGEVDGLVSMHVGRRVHEGDEQVVVITVWRDVDALIAAMGPNWNRSAFPAAFEGKVSRITVEHYETLDPDDTPDGGTLHVPDPLTASLPARDPSA